MSVSQEVDRGHVERASERPYPAGFCRLQILSYILKSVKPHFLCAPLFFIVHARGVWRRGLTNTKYRTTRLELISHFEEVST